MQILRKVTKQLEAEIDNQVSIVYGCGILALYRYWGYNKERILDILKSTEATWEECCASGTLSIFKMLEDETGIEMKIPQTNKSWHDLKLFNGKVHGTEGQIAYIRKRQIPWVGAEVLSSFLLGLYRIEGFSTNRLAEFMNKLCKIRDDYNFDKLKIVRHAYSETGIKVAGYELLEVQNDTRGSN